MLKLVFKPGKRKLKKRWYESDPIREKKFDFFVKSTKAVCTQAVLDGVQLSIYQKRRQDDFQ